MRVRTTVPMLSVVATLLASATPAYAFDPESPAGGSPPASPVAVGHSAGSSDLALELAAGAVVIAGGGLAAMQVRHRSARTADGARVVRGS